MKKFRFNVRVYGLWLKDNHVLISKEHVLGKEIIKFPGGGLDFGEGLVAALKREWIEELQLNICVEKHFYTTDYFQPSAWDDSQIISVYYLVHSIILPSIPLDNGQELFDWLPIDDNLPDRLTLPIDKTVGKLLLEAIL